jgi:hypothetical protein
LFTEESNMSQRPPHDELTRQRAARAVALVQAGDLSSAISRTLIPKVVSLTLSEALVLGLWRQGVPHFFAVFGHGSTEIGEVLQFTLAALQSSATGREVRPAEVT